jgi:hypothetical protein
LAAFGFLLTQLARRAGGEADALIDQLLVPRLADAEHVHRADFHVRDHLRRRHNDGRHIRVRIDPTGRQPVAHPQIMRPARECDGGFDFLAGGLLRFKGGLEF